MIIRKKVETTFDIDVATLNQIIANALTNHMGVDVKPQNITYTVDENGDFHGISVRTTEYK